MGFKIDHNESETVRRPSATAGKMTQDLRQATREATEATHRWP